MKQRAYAKINLCLLTEFGGQHSVGLFKNNGLVMPHNTKIYAIFVDVKAGDCSFPVHIFVFLIPPNIVKL